MELCCQFEEMPFAFSLRECCNHSASKCANLEMLNYINEI